MSIKFNGNGTSTLSGVHKWVFLTLFALAIIATVYMAFRPSCYVCKHNSVTIWQSQEFKDKKSARDACFSGASKEGTVVTITRTGHYCE